MSPSNRTGKASAIALAITGSLAIVSVSSLARAWLERTRTPAGPASSAGLDPGADRASLVRQERARLQAHFAQLDAVRKAQTTDVVWQAATRAMLVRAATAASQPGLAMRVAEVSCGASLCRAELSFEGASVALRPRLLKDLVSTVATALPEARFLHDDEGRRTSAYFARASTSLPPP